MKKRMVFVALLMASAVAQPAYKCRDGGRTYYSDSPDCKGEVGDSVSAAPAEAGEAKSPIERGRLRCAGLPLDWKPRHGLETGESFEFWRTGGGEMVPIKYAGRHMSARRYSADGENGGCYTSIDGRRLLRSGDVEELE
jgi:hypothetical protein